MTDDQLRAQRRRAVMAAIFGCALLLFVSLLPMDLSNLRLRRNALFFVLTGCFSLASGIGFALQSSWLLWKRRRP